MTASEDAEIVPVRVLGTPVALWARSRERHEGLLRELSLMALERDGEPDPVPTRLMAFGEDLRRRYGAMTGPASEQLDAAAEAGVETLDVEFEVPRSARAMAENYIEILEEVDAYCRDGDLLTLAPSPEIVTFRTWFLGEFARQLRGEPPLPWHELHGDTTG